MKTCTVRDEKKKKASSKLRCAPRKVLFLALLVFCQQSHAEPMQLIQWNCQPALGWLHVSAVEIDGSDFLEGTAHAPDGHATNEPSRKAEWQAAGIYDPHLLHLECKIGKLTFKLDSTRTEEERSPNNPPSVSLHLDERPLIVKAAFGTFGGGPNASDDVLSMIDIWVHPQNAVPSMTLCFSTGYSDKTTGGCSGPFAAFTSRNLFPIHGNMSDYAPPSDSKLFGED